MAVPKHKTSKAKRDSRRAQNYKMDMPGVNVCPQCGEIKAPHRVCPACGTYKGKTVVEIED